MNASNTETTPAVLTANITGHRTNSGKFGPQSDIMVTFDGQSHGPFAYYADAYNFALGVVGDAAKVTRSTYGQPPVRARKASRK